MQATLAGGCDRLGHVISMDLSADLDALFQLPLGEFTSARNALASRLQKAGRRDDAEQVRKLAKPPISAWVVNQLFWKERASFDRLLTSGAKLRQAQASGLAGKPVNVHDQLKAQREALGELSRQAAVFLSQNGHAPSPDVLRRVTLDLQGLAARGEEDRPAPGRLTADVQAQGFDALAALVPKSGDGAARGAGTSKVLSFAAPRPQAPPAKTAGRSDEARRERERAEAAAAKRAVQEAERALTAARRDATKAEAAMKTAAARLKGVEREKERAEAALEKASTAADAARQAARRTASEAADAAQAVDDAERALDRAKAQLQ
jgi:hypothetical protein